MLAKLNTFALVGIDAVPVEVEVDASAGLPKTILVGLPEMAVRESIHRIERALANLGYERHAGRTVINLAPADLRKDAGAFDLPIALGMLVATGQLLPEQLRDFAIVGELALDGSVRPDQGRAVDGDGRRRARHSASCSCRPPTPARPPSSRRSQVFGVAHAWPRRSASSPGSSPPSRSPASSTSCSRKLNSYDVDFADVRGQEFAKRALVVAAAGGHNVLMIGSPGHRQDDARRGGCRRSCRRLTPAESLETTRIYSALGRLPAGRSRCWRRGRSARRTTPISDAGMVGGGSTPAPGEISLAHHGVLFLDELPEFNRRSLEVLRQPLEEGTVTISRALHSTTFPASFILVAAMNPCPCGYLGDPRHACKCTPMQIERYMGRISGPLLDRIDLHIEVPAVPFQELSGSADGTSSAVDARAGAAARARSSGSASAPAATRSTAG